MNGSVEDAVKHTGQVTAKQLREVIRAFPRANDRRRFMHGRIPYDRPSYSSAFIFTVRCVNREREKRTETEAKIDVPGYVSNGHTSQRETRTHENSTWQVYSEPYRPRHGFWSLDHLDTLETALELLPADASVAFHVYLDAGTHEYLIRADASMQFGTEHGLHADQLYLVASFMKRGKPVELRFLLDTSIGAHNSARFGAPRHDRDTEGRAPG